MLGRSALLRSEKNLARWRQWKRLKNMSAENEKDVTQEIDAGGPIADSVMRGEDEGTLCLLMEQNRAKERRLIGSERCIHLFGNLPLPPGERGCDHPKRDALARDAAEVRNAVEGGVNAGGEQRVALLQCVKRVTPLLDGGVTINLCCECAVGGKVLVEKTEQLLEGAEGTE
jgi:hypothetical protein